MRRAAVLIGLMLGSIVLPGGELAAAERVPATASAQVLPFPRSPRAEIGVGSRACWSRMPIDLHLGPRRLPAVDSQGRCLKHTDACDRACQRDCRTRGGPYLPIEWSSGRTSASHAR